MEGNRRHQLGVAASSGGGGETRSQEHLCGAVASGGGGGENGGQEPLRGSIVGGRPAQSVDAAAGDAMRVVVAAACAVGVIPSAPKRKRGRPKGSKNKQKPTSDGEPTRKRGCPAGSKASPKRSLAQAMGHSQDTVPPVKQPDPALTPSQSLPGETSAASASVTHSVPIEASVPPSCSSAVQHSASPSTSSAGTPRKSPTRPPLIPAMYVDTLVEFAPEKEDWTIRQKTKDKYVGVGSAYLVGRMCRIAKGAMFQVQWLDSQYQNKDEHLNLSMIQRVDYHQDERSQHATHQQTLTPPLAPHSMTTRQSLLLRDLYSVVLGPDPWQVPDLDVAVLLDSDAQQVLLQLLRDVDSVVLDSDGQQVLLQLLRDVIAVVLDFDARQVLTQLLRDLVAVVLEHGRGFEAAALQQEAATWTPNYCEEIGREAADISAPRSEKRLEPLAQCGCCVPRGAHTTSDVLPCDSGSSRDVCPGQAGQAACRRRK
ncbi:hypothetical protein GQ600_11341 [Phytophthora cactorum]|nr:hypothetical protein GQ600_11341 [Phytophthora cactorum]